MPQLEIVTLRGQAVATIRMDHVPAVESYLVRLGAGRRTYRVLRIAYEFDGEAVSRIVVQVNPHHGVEIL